MEGAFFLFGRGGREGLEKGHGDNFGRRGVEPVGMLLHWWQGKTIRA